MEFYSINLKEFQPTVELAVANLLIEIDVAKSAGVKGLKVIHGYGSHNVGGGIRQELKSLLPRLVKQKKIRDFISGVDWNFASPKTFAFLKTCPTASLDDDLNHSNVGITILIL